jgi:hypothetical protein
MSEVVKRPEKGIYVPPGRKRLEQQNPSSEEKPSNNPLNNLKSQINSKNANTNASSETSQKSENSETSTFETKTGEKFAVESKITETPTELPPSSTIEKREETENEKSEKSETEKEPKSIPTSENKEEPNNNIEAENENSKIKVDIEPEISPKSDEIKTDSELEVVSNAIATPSSTSPNSKITDTKEEPKTEVNTNDAVQTNTNPLSPPSSPSRKKPDIQLFVPRRRLEAMEEEKTKKEKMMNLKF